MRARQAEAILTAALCAIGGVASAAPFLTVQETQAAAAPAPAVGAGDSPVQPVGYLEYARPAASGWTFDHTTRVRGGLTYYDDAFSSQLGAGYSLDMAVPFTETFSGLLSASHNHSERGSQYLGTLGWFRQGSAYGSWLNGLSGGMLFDQFTDTRFDDLYVSQLRLFVGYALSDWVAAGVTYFDPVQGDASAGVGLPGFPATASFRTAETIEAFVSARSGQNLITARVGHRDDLDAVVAGLLHQRKISNRLGAFASLNYQDGSTWSASAGLEFWFGSGGCRRGRRSCDYAAADVRSDERVVVRGQSSSGSGNPFTDPTLGGNLHYDAQTFGSQLVGTSGGVDILTVPDNVDSQQQTTPQNDPLTQKCMYLNAVQRIDPSSQRAVLFDAQHPCNQVFNVVK